jgi:SAM-dependent methyltransferase
MSHNKTNPYNIESHIAEIYDQVETDTDDVVFIRKLIGAGPRLRILEPFCGTGRISIPLARDGHSLVGMDQAGWMLERARSKISRLSKDIQERITLLEQDVTSAEWPYGFDLVILGGNCMYELATPIEQEKVIGFAAASVKLGGFAYLDNDHMEGGLAEAWQKKGARIGFPTGVCSDGTSIESSLETIWCNVPDRLVKFRRISKAILPDGRSVEREYVQQKHPVSVSEIRTWLGGHGFDACRIYGDHKGDPFVEASERAIFWASKIYERDAGLPPS